MTGIRGAIVQDLMSASLRECLNSLERQYEASRGSERAKREILRLTVSLFGNTELIIKSCVLFWSALHHADVNFVALLKRGWATPEQMRRAFNADKAPYDLHRDIVVEKESIVFSSVTGSPRFSLSFRYLPFLVQFSALLVNLVDFPAIKRAKESAASAGSAEEMDAAIAVFIRKWRKVKKPLMAKEQQLSKFKTMVKSLEDHLGEDFTRADVDDHAIIAIWDDHLLSPVSIGLTRYRSCVEGVTLLLECWARGEARFMEKSRGSDSLDRAERHSAQREYFGSGGQDISDEGYGDQVDTIIFGVFEGDGEDRIQSLLETLTECDFNILTNTECRTLTELLLFSHAVRHLHLSRLRSYTFDWGQGRLSTAVGANASADELAEKLNVLSKKNYTEINERLAKAYDSLQAGLLAIGHILLEHDRQFAIEYLVSLAGVEGMAALNLKKSADVGSRGEVISEYNAALERGDIPEFIAPIASQAQGEFKRLSAARSGFSEKSLQHERMFDQAMKIAESYSDQLTLLQNRKKAFTRATQSALYEEDAEMFRMRLKSKYIPNQGEYA